MSEVDKRRRNGIPDKDFTDQTFGELKVIEYAGNGRWKCQCSCGAVKVVRRWDLENRQHPTCGDRTKHLKTDLTGKSFGSWYVIRRTENGKWLCKCDCEHQTQREITTYELTSGHTKSCGHATGKVIDMTGKTLYELTFKEYLGYGYWKCECSCGNVVKVNARDVRAGNTKSCGHIKGGKVIDLKGKSVGEWNVIEYVGNSYWMCKCSCGEIKNVHSYTLRNNMSTNCGGPKHRIIDLKGKKFGELQVIDYVGDGFWKCECSCKNIKNILGTNLRNGSTKSCGCKSDEFLRQTLLSKYGEVCPSKVHNPRDLEQIKTLNDASLLESLIMELSNKLGRKPMGFEVAESLNIHSHTLLAYVKQFGLESLLDLNENNNVSSYEKVLRSMFPGAITSDKKTLNGLELDLLYPDKKIAIEFNGNYWHSTLYKGANYHQNKTLACMDKGIRLIHIFEYEWNDSVKHDKIVNLLENALGSINDNIIYARDTEVKHIGRNEAQLFLCKYHLQGYAESSLHLGCYYQNELIGVMTFGKPRFNSEYQYELIRLCWKPGIKVVGGIEKLFSHFKIEYLPKSIITYCDIAKFTGDSYLKLGFKPIESNPITKPNYVWLHKYTNETLSRYQTQKHKLIALGLGSEDETEDEIMERLGYLKIYDSGNIRLEWKSN